MTALDAPPAASMTGGLERLHHYADGPADALPATYRFDALREVPGLIVYSGAVATAYLLFRDVVSPLWMTAWIIPTALFLVGWLAFIVAIGVRKPIEKEVDTLWAPLARAIMHGTTIVVITSIWILMPPADERARLIMLVFYSMFAPVVIMTATARGHLDRFACVGPAASIALVYILFGGPNGHVVSAFAIGYCVLMLTLAEPVRHAIRANVTARTHSEAISRGLAAALAEAAAEREARNRFIAAAYHDLTQPLQAAQLFFEQYTVDPLSARGEKAAQKVRWAQGVAAAQLDQLVDHLRLESGARQPFLSEVSLNEAFAAVRHVTEPMALLKSLSIKVMPTSLSVLADPSFLDRILGNLAANAIHHASARRVVIGARLHASLVKIWVIDDGVGIPEAEQAIVFDDFRQGSGKGVDRAGFGLGLASARRMAELMGGRLTLDARWRHGSAFCLELPRAGAPG